MSFSLSNQGIMFHYDDPKIDQIEIVDVAHALSNICRFGGHTERFYSVAEHSVLCSELVAPKFALSALLHDAHEAYVLDVPTPLKRMMPQYMEIERRFEITLRQKFGVPVELSPAVKKADAQALWIERYQLLPPHDGWWEKPEDLVLPERKLSCYPPHIAKAVFLQRFYDLVNNVQVRGDRV